MALTATQRLFLRATRNQGRVLSAMFLRDLLSEVGGTAAGAVMLLLRPTIMVVLMYFVYKANKTTPQGMPLLGFLVTGWLAYFAFLRTFKSFKGSGAATKILMFPQVTTLDTILSNIFLEWYVYTLVFLLFVMAALMIERSPAPADPLGVILAFWGVSLFGSLLGLIVSSLARVAPVLDSLTMVYRRLAVMVSGIAVSAADTPGPILKYLSWSPLFQCIELMRQAWWPAYVSPIADAGYVVKVLFFMMAFGLAIERFTRKYVE